MRKFRVWGFDSRSMKMSLSTTSYQTDKDICLEFEAEEIGDEYHTMHELYQHRMALNIALFHVLNIWDYEIAGTRVMKSKLHNDGTMFEGYFIVMAITPVGQISYHYKLKHWDKFQIPEVERTPKWDGHGSLEVMERLMKL